MTDTTKQLEKEIINLKDSIANITKQIGELTKEKLSSMKEGEKNIADNISNSAYKLGQKARKSLEDVEESGAKMVHYVEDQIKEHPLTSVGVVFLVGWIISKISFGHKD